MRRLRWLLPAVVLVLSACQGPLPQPGPNNGGTMTVAIAGDPVTLNRFVAGDLVSTRAVAPLFPMLYTLAQDMSVVPDLATGPPAISADGLAWTVRIRTGARWSDGKAITADDVVSTVNIQRDPNLDKQPGAIFVWDKLSKVEKVDDHTVRFTLTERYAPFYANSLVTFVAPAHVYGLVDPSRMRQDPIGNQPTVTGGPFKFDKRVAGQEVDYVANPDYYGGRPHIDKLVFKVIPDATTAANGLLSGDVNWQPDAAPAEVVKLKGSATYTRRYPDTGYWDVRFNDRPDHLFGDKAVRQAFAYALDKEALVKDLTSGNGTPVYGDLLPTSWAYDGAAVVKYKQNLDRSRQLLKDAGWTPGPDGVLVKAGRRFSADFLVRKDSTIPLAAVQAISEKVKAVGMELKPTPLDYGAGPGQIFRLLKDGKFDIALSGFSTGPDPDNYFLFHTSQFPSDKNPNGSNWSGYTNPELDRLIDQQRSTLLADAAQTRVERKKIFSQEEKLLGDEVVTYFLWADNTVHGFDTGVAGVPQGTLINLDYARNSKIFASWYLTKH